MSALGSTPGDSTATFLAEAGKVPLLDTAQEVMLGRALRECHEEHEHLLLSSPLVWAHILAWGERVKDGQLDAAELMLRGHKTPAAVAGMRRRLAGACKAIRAVLADRNADRSRLVARLAALNLNRKRLLSLAASDPAVAALTAEALGRIALLRTSLVEANIRLAVSVAKGFTFSRMEFGDLVQEGALGLMKAADRFDERRGFKFSTYATWWIRQSIQRAITDKTSTIRLPVHVQALREKIRGVQRRHMLRFGREATSSELARTLGVSAKRLLAVLQSAQDPLSISAEPTGVDDASLEDILPDNEQPTALAIIKSSLRVDEVESALGKISEREALVLRLRFGIGQERERTLEECGKQLGLTRERVRQIEHKAIQKLKAPRLALRLKDYWGRGQ